MRAIAPTVEQRQQPLLSSIIPMFGPQLLEDWRADQTLLRLSHVVLGLGPDERLLRELQWLPARDLLAHFLDQAVSHVLQHYRLQRERGRAGAASALHQRTPAQRLHCLEDCCLADAWAHARDQLGDAHWLARYGQHAQQLLLERRAAFDLLGQQTSDTTEDRSCALVQERTDVAVEHLPDALADHLQGQAIAPESANQIGPILVIA